MAGTNDFKAFATDANANVTSQEEWETLTALKKGFSSGKASSAQVSKALRQPSTMAAVLGQFIANAELDALDDGDVDGLVAKLATAITTNLGLGEAAKRDVGTGDNQIPDMSYWSSPAGGINFPNGFQMRFGTIAGTGGKLFSTPFTNQCYGIVFGQTYGANYWMFSPMYRASDLSNTGFAFINKAWSGVPGVGSQDAGESVFYIAVGY
nr:MAG TPA: putative tail fiber protein [Caudoviricetes sp.]